MVWWEPWSFFQSNMTCLWVNIWQYWGNISYIPVSILCWNHSSMSYSLNLSWHSVICPAPSLHKLTLHFYCSTFFSINSLKALKMHSLMVYMFSVPKNKAFLPWYPLYNKHHIHQQSNVVSHFSLSHLFELQASEEREFYWLLGNII